MSSNTNFLEILTSDVKLPPLPDTGAKLLEFTQKPIDQIDISTFVGLVETDPSLTSKVLQLANSPYYGSTDKIIGLRKAVIRIGLDEAINSVCLYFFQKMLPKVPAIEGFSLRDYWAHSWACAIANRRLGHPNLKMDVMPGELYIAGLLHGIGKLILAIHSPWEFSNCIRESQNRNLPLHVIEQDVFGITDAFLASKMMEQWHLPDSICAAVGFYTEPQSSPEPFRKLAGLTQFAYCIVGLSGIGGNGDGLPMDIEDTWIFKQSGLELNEPNTRNAVIHEIIESIAKKSESIAGVTPKKTVGGGSETRENRRNSDPGGKNFRSWKGNGSLLAKIFSFFRGCK